MHLTCLALISVRCFLLFGYLTVTRADGSGVPTKHEDEHERVVELKWYLHDTPFNGPSRSSIPVTAYNASDFQNELTNFLRGQIYVFDDPLTLGPSIKSPAFGRAQGTYTFVSGNELVAYVSYTVRIQAGKYNGSSITVLGVAPESGPSKTYVIAGGTGKFALARGILEESVVNMFGPFNFSSTIAQHATISIHY